MIGMCVLTGCADMGIVGTGSTESAVETSTEATVESTLDSSASEDLTKIVNAAKKLGITGSYYESYTSKEDEPDQSAVNHGADYYVVIYNDDGDAYYGAIVGGEVKIWAADEVYDTSSVDASDYEGNLVIKLNTPDGFTNDVGVTLWCYGEDPSSDITTVDVAFTKDTDYTTSVTVPAGDCNVFDYDIIGDDNNIFYIEKDTFAAKDEQTIVTLNVHESLSTGTADIEDSAAEE